MWYRGFWWYTLNTNTDDDNNFYYSLGGYASNDDNNGDGNLDKLLWQYSAFLIFNFKYLTKCQTLVECDWYDLKAPNIL